MTSQPRVFCLLIASVLFFSPIVACTTGSTDDTTSTPSPTSPPTPYGFVRTLSIEQVHETLGYALAPTYLPPGIYVSEYLVDYLSALLIYGSDGQQVLSVSYPTPVDSLMFHGLQPPEDAVFHVEVSGRDGYAVRGEWSASLARSLLKETPPDPNVVHWDYDMSISLFFQKRISGEREVDIHLRARPSSESSLSFEDLIKIAESFQIVAPSP